MRRFYFSFLLLFLGISSSLWAGNFNFPQNKDYPYGQRVTSATAGADIQSIYTSWKNQFYVEGTKNNVPMARIKFTDASHGSPNGEHTVSEGIGYGMLIFVYMENATNQTQDEFNKLWAYYQAFDNNSNGLMEWETNGFSDVYKQGAATDGDLDVATALLLADKQWGSSGAVDYVSAAKKLLNNIFNNEVNGDFLKPGDAWDDVKNPCYFTLAAFRLFDKAQTQYGFTGADNHNWKAVFEKSNSYLSTVQGKSSAGLYPDWSKADGTNPNSSSWKYEYGMDACRTPWRVVWDYLWYGTYTSTPNSQTLSQKTATWVSTNAATPSNTGDKYNLDGTKTGSWNNAAYMGGFGTSLMIDAKYSNLLTSYYNATRDFSTSEYYQKSLQILYTLLMSGNCPNFFDGSPVSGRISGATIPATATTIELTFSKALKTIVAADKANFTVKVNGTAATIASLTPNTTDKTKATLTFATAFKSTDVVTLSYTGTSIIDVDNLAVPKTADYPVTNSVPANGLLISDCNDTIVATGGPWYSYNDNSVKGGSTVTPLSSKNTPFIMTEPGFKGTGDKCAKIEITLLKAGFAYDPFVGVGFKILKDSTPVGTSWATATGIEFYHKGVACVISPFMSNFMDGAKVSDNQWYQDIPAHADWTLVKITFDKTATTGLKLPPWFSAAQITAAPAIDPTKFFKIQFQVQSAVVGFTGDLYLDELTIAGVTPKAADKTLLVTALALAKTTLDAAVTGEGNGQYPLAAYNTLSAARATASTVNDDTKATQAAVDAQTKALTDAIAAFKLTVITVTKTALKTSLDAAIAFNTTAIEGSGNGQYPAAAKTTFVAAIATAQAVYDAAGSSQAAVTQAKTDLDAALVTFKATKVTVIKTLLANAITAADTKVGAATPAQYPAAAITAYTTAINAAKAVNTAAAATQAEVDQAIKDLATATTAFDAAKISVDNTQLVSAISAATTLVGNAVPGAGNGQYPQTAITAYNTAITAATSVKNTATTQAEIETAITNLATATTAFNAAKISVDKSLLLTAISDADVKATAAIPGSADGQYPQAAITAYKSAIAAAKTINSAAGSSQAVVNQAILDLDAATKTFDATKVGVIKTVLTDSIGVANKLIASAKPAGAGNGQYAQADITTYQTAIDAATTVNTSAASTQAQVDAAVTALATATKAFKAKVIVVDYSALTAKITAMNALYIASTEGSGNGQYPAPAKANLQTAIDAAQLVASNKTATQAAVTAAVTALTTAETTFNSKKVVVDYSLLVAAIKSASDAQTAASIGNGNGQYPSTANATLLTAISAANAVAGKTDATQAAVSQAKSDIDAALLAFNAAKITVDFTNLTKTIDTATTLSTSVTIGTANGEYLQSVVTAFEAKIATANAVKTKTNVTAAEVATATSNLSAAIAAFKTSANSVAATDFTALKKAITDANTALTGKTTGTNPCEYLQAEVTKLTTAISTAQAMVTANTAKQGEANTEEGVLKQATSDFLNSKIAAANNSALVTAIGDANSALTGKVTGDLPGQYPQVDVTTFTNAITAAQTVASNTCATAAQIAAAAKAVTDAKDLFLTKVVKAPSKDDLNIAIQTATPLAATPAASIGTNPGQYSQATLTALQTALQTAKTVYANATATPTEVLSATTGLNTAISNFNASLVPAVDKTNLDKAISTATPLAATPAANIGTNPGQYTQAKVDAVKAALATANTVSANPAATTTEVKDATDALTLAISQFTANGAANKSLLVTAINNAVTASTPTPVAGTLPGQYPQTAIDSLTNVLAQARAVNNSASSTQAMVDAVVSKLNLTVTYFTNAKVGATDKSSLSTAINNAKAKVPAAANIGTGDGQYTQTAVNTLNNAIAAAQLVFDNPLATPTMVSSAVSTLNAAVAAFKPNVVVTVNTATLEKDTATASALLKVAVGGTRPTQYNQAALDALKTSLVTARYYLNNNLPQADIDAADKDIVAKINAVNASLVPAVDKQLLNQAIYSANAIEPVAGDLPGQYPAALVTAFQTALTNAQAVYDQKDATAAEVSAAKNALSSAKTAMLAQVVPPLYTLDLEYAITQAKATIDNIMAGNVGSLPSQYTAADSTKLANAIAAATVVLRSSTSNQAAIDKAVVDLKAVKTSIKPTPATDKTTLNAAITSANDAMTGISIGSNAGDYPQAKVTALLNAKNAAILISTKSTATAAEVLTATNTLKAAITALKNSKITGIAIDSTVEFKHIVANDVIEFTVTGAEITSVDIVSLLGVTMTKVSARGNELNIALDGFATGYYIAIVTLSNNETQAVKFVK